MKAPTTQLAAVAYIAATFLIGALAGGAVGYGYGRKPIVRPFDREAMRAHICNDLTSKLDLTPAQQQQLDPIVRQNMEEFDADRRQQMAKMGERMKAGSQRIRAILTPGQQVKFDELERQRWTDRERNHDRPRPKAEAAVPAFGATAGALADRQICQDSAARPGPVGAQDGRRTGLSPVPARP
ncbi:MAG: hypothetical protein WCP53_12185 [Verrucomicrobiota bacterium]